MIQKMIWQKKEHISTTDDSMVEATPKQILDFLEKAMLEFEYADPNNNYAKSRALPAHAKLFFVSSYKGEVKDLLKNEADPKKRFEQFLKDPINGEEATEKAFSNALHDKDAWKKAKLVLLDDTDANEELNASRIGMKNLLKAVQKKSADAYRDAASKLIKEYEDQKADIERNIRAQDEWCPESPDVVGTMMLVLRKFVETYMVLAHDELYNPDTKKTKCPDVEDQVSLEMKNSWDENRKDFGWTLSQEHEIYKSLNRQGHFPPQDPKYCEDDWEKKVQGAGSLLCTRARQAPRPNSHCYTSSIRV
jgi:hypothetical protein